MKVPTRVARLDPSAAAVIPTHPNEKKHQTANQRNCVSLILPRARKEDLAPLSLTVGEEAVAEIGSGSYGKCKKMMYHGNIPAVVKTFQSHVKRNEVLHEVRVMLALQNQEHHQWLPFLLGVNCSTLHPYIIVTQFFGNNQYTLKTAVDEELFVTERGWASTFQSLARTLSYVHNKNYLHNDIKQNNIVCHNQATGTWGVVLIKYGKMQTLQNSCNNLVVL